MINLDSNILIRISKEEKKNLKRIALEKDTVVSEILRKAIEKYIKENKKFLNK